MKLSSKILFATIIILFLSNIAYSEVNSDVEGSLTLDKALGIAFEHNPSMIEARQSIVSAKGDKISTMALDDPEISFEIGGLKKVKGEDRQINLDKFEIKQDFGPVGTYWVKNRIAKNDVLIKEEVLRSVWGSIYLEVREAYSKLILNKKRSELARENLNILRQFFSKVQLRYKSGLALKNDVQRAKIEMLMTETDYISVEKELKTDEAKLNLLMGREIDGFIDIEEELEVERLKFDFKELRDLAFSSNPILRKEKLLLDSSNRNVTLEQLRRFPAPFVGFERINTDYEDDYTVIIGMTIPLWDFNQGEVKKARALKKIQRARESAAERQVAYNVYEAFLDTELAQRQLELLEKSIEEANELLRLANLKYGEGEIDFINYLDQVRMAAETRMRYYQGLFDFNRAITKLENIVYTSLREEDYLQ